MWSAAIATDDSCGPRAAGTDRPPAEADLDAAVPSAVSLNPPPSGGSRDRVPTHVIPFPKEILP